MIDDDRPQPEEPPKRVATLLAELLAENDELRAALTVAKNRERRNWQILLTIARVADNGRVSAEVRLGAIAEMAEGALAARKALDDSDPDA
jgi:hypothetical protein